jgi:hypothetical protein
VRALQQSSPAGKQHAALALWELLYVPASQSVSPHMATLVAGQDSLVPGLSWALDASCWAAAGLIQALTCEPHKCVRLMGLLLAAPRGLQPVMQIQVHGLLCRR